MIKDIELRDFISHKDTKLEFGKGITVFIGHNGSGKSSVIDAITFSLFGKHTRKSNKNLIRRGANLSSVAMRFTVNSKEYRATRTLGSGNHNNTSQFEMLVDGGGVAVNKKISAGERKGLGESTTVDEITKVIGLNYDKLRVAAVVQQGELGRIIESSPKEFKELLNSLIGIDRLDSAYQTMREVIEGFRDRLKDETGGYDDRDTMKVEDQIKQASQKLQDSESTLMALDLGKKELEDRIFALDKEIERMEPLVAKIKELETKERWLISHVNDKRSLIQADLVKMERIAKEARSCLQAVENKTEIQMRLDMVKSEIDEVQCAMVENEGLSGKLKGFLDCASRLKITDGKCPVCSSAVQKVNNMFDLAHIQSEIARLAEHKSKLQQEKVGLKREDQQLTESDKKITAAEKFLSGNEICSVEDVIKIEQDLERKRKDLAQLPPQSQITRIHDPHALVIDEASKTLAGEVSSLRESVRGFSHQKYGDAKLEKTSVSQKLQEINRTIGMHQKEKEVEQNNIESARKVAVELAGASEFIRVLERIRLMIFNRDGMVGMSLRSWALKTISARASEYAAMFNIGISRVDVTEGAKEISIACYGRQGEVDMDSLSGGEKVAIALALRLGIAYMMGSNKLDFIILDEPTTYLDEERRKALVRIISEAFRDGSGPLSQMLIITHDSEIFENSEVDMVYRFAMTAADGSSVCPEKELLT